MAVGGESELEERALRSLEPPPSPSLLLGQALTLDNGQHSVGTIQRDGEAQGPQIPLLVEQVVQLLLSGGTEERTWSPRDSGWA